jgi:hypothetical protein
LIGLGGGRRSSKTETVLAEIVGLATGVFPQKYEKQFREKFKWRPINVRICIESLKSNLHAILLPKLQYWTWLGPDKPGGKRGHWGWVPRACLIDGRWEKSWSEHYCMLTVLCRDPDDPERILGHSKIQIMSYDQEGPDYASGTFDIVQMDEPPPYPIWLENQSRVLDVDGRIILSMTWPEDPAIPVDWIYDEVYEKGLPGPLKDPNIDWFELDTRKNKFIDQEGVAKKSERWSEETRKVKLEGQPLRFAHRVHPLFTDIEQTWCFSCRRNCIAQDGCCGCERKSIDIQDYVHVEDFEVGQNWPVVFVIDPHPRKPHMMLWIAVDPSDDFHIIQEGEVEGDAPDVKVFTEEIEESMGLDVRLRLMDPNMGRSPTSRRDISWQDEFDNAGLCLDLADDSDVGRSRVNNLLEPDHHTRRPRLIFHSRCRNAATQMKRHVWDDFRRSADREQKQVPKKKYDDYPTMLKYFANYEPTFRTLYAGAPILTRPGTRKGGY